jgi:deoxyribonuclease V
VYAIFSQQFKVQPVLFHPWDLCETEARRLQTALAEKVVTEDRFPKQITSVAGVDVAYEDGGKRAFAAVAVVDMVEGKLEQIVSAEEQTRFPYLPGLLSFREVPVLAAAFEKLSARPDLIICDGQGIAHPRRFGMACHVGVIYDIPSIGCAKTRLIGTAEEPSFTRGSITPLVSGGEIVGALLRTRDGVKPLYISSGHRISLRTACDWILTLCSRYRLPDPIRMADQIVNKLKREAA